MLPTKVHGRPEPPTLCSADYTLTVPWCCGSPASQSDGVAAGLLQGPGNPHSSSVNCSDTFINNFLVYFAANTFGAIPLCGIIFSYTHTVSSVLRTPSVGGKYKAFPTCGSHFSVVSLFYERGFGVYISPALTNASRNTAVVSMMYTIVPEMTNDKSLEKTHQYPGYLLLCECIICSGQGFLERVKVTEILGEPECLILASSTSSIITR